MPHLRTGSHTLGVPADLERQGSEGTDSEEARKRSELSNKRKYEARTVTNNEADGQLSTAAANKMQKLSDHTIEEDWIAACTVSYNTSWMSPGQKSPGQVTGLIGCGKSLGWMETYLGPNPANRPQTER